jgi:hypothetical protein
MATIHRKCEVDEPEHDEKYVLVPVDISFIKQLAYPNVSLRY